MSITRRMRNYLIISLCAGMVAGYASFGLTEVLDLMTDSPKTWEEIEVSVSLVEEGKPKGAAGVVKFRFDALEDGRLVPLGAEYSPAAKLLFATDLGYTHAELAEDGQEPVLRTSVSIGMVLVKTEKLGLDSDAVREATHAASDKINRMLGWS